MWLIGVVAFVMTAIPIGLAFAAIMIPESERRRTLIAHRDRQHEIAFGLRPVAICRSGHPTGLDSRYCETCGVPIGDRS